eukprot:SAG11_NODE_4487_length_1877_cov_1.735096_1_plen_361_part_10
MVLLLVVAAAVLAAAAARPNFLMMLADDLGYNEVGFMNSSRGLHTPRLDRLAATGVVLTEYRVAPMCSPTRSATMAGRSIIRLGTQGNTLAANAPWGISLEETFLPQNLKDAGYITAMWGKWHLGMWTEDYTPTRRGFDEFVGYYQGEEDAYTHRNVYPTWDGYDWFVGGMATNASGEWELPIMRDAALKFIQKQAQPAAAAAAAPWFGYFAFREVHSPFEVAPQYQAAFRHSECCGGTAECARPMWAGGEGLPTTTVNATLCAMISAIDETVGELIDALNRSAQLERTIVIWSSDNGAPTATHIPPHVGPSHTGGKAGYSIRNWPLKGNKGDLWDGGVKVPAVVWSASIAGSAVAGTSSA